MADEQVFFRIRRVKNGFVVNGHKMLGHGGEEIVAKDKAEVLAATHELVAEWLEKLREA